MLIRTGGKDLVTSASLLDTPGSDDDNDDEQGTEETQE
jgi:hypothetical protein